MKLLDILLISYKGVQERRFRFILNLLGIFIGCMAVTALISMTQGLNDLVGNQLDLFGPNNIWVMPGSLEMGAGLIAQQSFNWRDIQTLNRIANIDIIAPIIGGKMASFTQQGQRRYAFIYGVDAEYFEIMSGWGIEEGRCLHRGDVGVAVLGKEIADPKDENLPRISVGDRLTLTAVVKGEDKDIKLRVVGIIERVGGIGGVSSDEDQSIYIPLKACQQLYEVGGEFQYIACRVRETEDLPQVVSDIEEQLGDDITVMTAEYLQETIGIILGAVEAVLGGVAAISLLVAGVGIINTMTISVLERTKEIGIMKAIGCKSVDVLLTFLNEAVITGIVGGALGSATGLILGNVIGNSIDMPVSSSPYLGLGVVMFAVVTSGVSGLYPAWRAARMHPVDALRSE
jgi:putative ABC transport system permease protein